MSFKLGWYTIVTLIISIATSSAWAVEALSTEELKLHCAVYNENPEGTDGVFCIRYIQGFIDGAVATDERVAHSVADEYGRVETATERHIRARLASSIEKFGSSYYAGYCLGEPLPLVEVVGKIITDLMEFENLEGRELARDVVYETLRREYPCKTNVR